MVHVEMPNVRLSVTIEVIGGEERENNMEIYLRLTMRECSLEH